jgi:GT2 family glycosyltransferase
VAAPEALFRDAAAARISVVVPACNESTWLERTITQFRATLPSRSEIIVIDNGSTDGCADFLARQATPVATRRACSEQWREWQQVRNGITTRLVQTPQPLGVAGARNLGLDYATGEVVVWADAHVDVPAGWWPPLVATLNRPGVGLVGPAFGVLGDPDYIKMYGQYVADAKLRTQWLPQRAEEPYPVPVLGGGFLAMRHDVLAQTGAFDAGMQQWGSEDLELSLRLWLLGYEVWMVPEVEVPHYFRDRNPYHVEWQRVIANQLRTIFLHLSGERLARAVHGLMDDPRFPRAMAACAESDLWQRREELLARRVHDDDWFFNHPYFQDIEMER